MGEMFDKIKGKAKEIEGKLTGDKLRTAQGEAEQAGAEVKDKAGSAIDQVKEAARNAGEKAKEMAEKAKDKAAAAVDKVKDAAKGAEDKAKEKEPPVVVVQPKIKDQPE